MALPVMRMTVWIETDPEKEPDEYELDVKHVDRLQAELHLRMLGMDADTPLNLTTAWAWAAAKRTGVHGGPLAKFLNGECAGLEVVESAEEEVPPTTEGLPTGSPSS